MVHIFHFLPTSLVFEIVHPFLWIFNAISSDKRCLISTRRQDTRIFPACWILFGQFKFPARQPYATCVSERLMGAVEIQIAATLTRLPALKKTSGDESDSVHYKQGMRTWSYNQCISHAIVIVIVVIVIFLGHFCPRGERCTSMPIVSNHVTTNNHSSY